MSTQSLASPGWLARLARLREVACPPAQCTAGDAPLRLLQLTNMYPSAERPNWGVFIRSQIDSLARSGVASEVLEIEGWRSKANYLRALAVLPRRASARRYDLLHVHFGLNALACLGVRGLPMVVSFCGDDFWGKPDHTGRRSRRSLLLAALCKRVARRAEAIIVKSAEMARALEGSHPHIVVIANGLDLELFDPISRADARRQLGWPQEREILLFPANPAEPRKNFALAQEVERRLLAEGRPVELRWVYGRPQGEVVLAMGAADVMLNSSFQEGSPNAVKEAMAMNLPVVSTAAGDCRERLLGCFPGAVVAREAQAFTEATRAVLQLGGQRSNGRHMAISLDLDSTALRVVEVYRGAIERHRARRGGG